MLCLTFAFPGCPSHASDDNLFPLLHAPTLIACPYFSDLLRKLVNRDAGNKGPAMREFYRDAGNKGPAVGSWLLC